MQEKKSGEFRRKGIRDIFTDIGRIISFRGVNKKISELKSKAISQSMKKGIERIQKTHVSDIMIKGVVTTAEDASVWDVMAYFTTRNIGCVIVKDGERVTGIITERDILRTLLNRDVRDYRAKDVMTAKVITGKSDMTIVGAISFIVRQKVRKIPIVSDGLLTGIVTQTDLQIAYDRFFERNEFLGDNMPDVQAYMNDNYTSAEENEMVDHAMRKMLANSTNAILVKDNELLLGIITERDVLSEFVVNPRFISNTPVGAVMKKKIVSVSPHMPIHLANRIMIDKNVRRLPVIQNGEVAGIITQNEILVAIDNFLTHLLQEGSIFEVEG